MGTPSRKPSANGDHSRQPSQSLNSDAHLSYAGLDFGDADLTLPSATSYFPDPPSAPDEAATDGIVNGAVAGTGQSEAVTPWLFQDPSARSAKKATPRKQLSQPLQLQQQLPSQPLQAQQQQQQLSFPQSSPSGLSNRAQLREDESARRTRNRTKTNDSMSATYSIIAPYASGNGQSSVANLSSRPTTPPYNASSSSSVGPSSASIMSTSTTSKRSKNPFSFLKKKSSNNVADPPSHSHSHASTSRPGSSHDAAPAPVRNPSLPRQAPLMPASFDMTHVPSRIPSSKAPDYQSVGLDEELRLHPSNETEQLHSQAAATTDAKREKEKRRLLTRPLGWDRTDSSHGPRGHSSHGSRNENSTGALTPKAGGGVGDSEVILSLDTNFDQIDDIVNPAAAAARQQSEGSGSISTSSISTVTTPFDSPSDRSMRPSLASSLGRRQTSDAKGRTLSTTGRPGSSRSSSSEQVPTLASIRGGGLPAFDSLPPRTGIGSGPSSPTTASPSHRPSQLNLTKSNLPPTAFPGFLLSHPNGAGTSSSGGGNGRGVRRVSIVDQPQYAIARDSFQPLSMGGNPRANDNSDQPSNAIGESANYDGLDSASTTTTNNEDPLALRKDSATSAYSGRSGFSGVSPKTSMTQLVPGRDRSASIAASVNRGLEGASREKPESGHWALNGQTLVEGPAGYTFPPSTNVAQGELPLAAHRGSSASSGQGVVSSWLAPDSWAVQPGDLGGGDDDDDSDGSADGLAERERRISSSGTGGTGPSSFSAATPATGGTPGPSTPADLYARQASLVESRRGTSESIGASGSSSSSAMLSAMAPGVSNSSSGGPPLASESPRPASIEVLEMSPQEDIFRTPQILSSPVLAPPPLPAVQNVHVSNTSSGRPASSRGSAFAAAGGAAAAAAGKLGLHRPRGKQTRPSTAGSIGAGTSFSTGVTYGRGGAGSAAVVASTQAQARAEARAEAQSMAHSTSGHGHTGAGEEEGGLGLSRETREGSVGSVATTPSGLRSDFFFGRETTRKVGQGSSGKSTQHFVRVWKSDQSFSTISCSLSTTTAEIRTILARKAPGTDTGAFRLFVRDKGSERPLGASERPAQLQRRRLEQAGYEEADGLEEVGRDDLSFLLRFVYRMDSVPTFDSDSIVEDEQSFAHLRLDGYNLEMVPIVLYRHADWIVSLDLSGNPMSDLPLDFVQLCSNLRILRLSSLALKRIPQSVRHSETLTHLDVSNNRLPDLGHLNLSTIPELRSIKVQNNRLSELPSYFSRIETLRTLNVSNNRFEAFPTIVCSLRALVDLDLSFNSISSLPAELGQLKCLERLVLVGNSIEILPPGMAELESLTTLDVRRNLIQDVTPIFGLPRLQFLQCEHNSIKSFDIKLNASLRSLEMGHNPLGKAFISMGDDIVAGRSDFITPDVNTPTSLLYSLGPMSLTSDLAVLNLSSANLSKLDDALFPQIPALGELVLDHNQFLMLPETLGHLVNLTRLSCSNNNLATLPDSLGQLSKLITINLHNNNLTSLPSSIWHCENLVRINVSSNLLESFPAPPSAPVAVNGETGGVLSEDPLDESTRKGSVGSLGGGGNGQPQQTKSDTRATFALTRCLTKLRLGDNRLTDDVFEVLGRLVSLEVLNLSFNEIYEIPNYSLAKYVCLRELYLSGNNLSSIPADDLEHMAELRILHLNGNKLQSLPAELGKLRKLANLDVGNNVLKYNIANWHYDWHWNSNPELRYLNFSGNKRFEIKSIEDGARRRDVSDFNRLQKLRVLGLMDVTMTLQSADKALPDETEDRRVRTSLSQINGLAYGIADALGKHDNLSIIDFVTPRFRKEDNECLFGLFDGRDHSKQTGSRIAKHLAEWINYRVEWELRDIVRVERLASANGGLNGNSSTTPTETQIPNVMRRAFLRLEKEYADMLMLERQRKMSEAHTIAAADSTRASAPAIATSSQRSFWQSGASAVIAYIVDRTLYVANVGDSLAVLSRNGGTAHLVSTKHEPFDRAETERIRSAEGWVSLRGYVNDTLDVSRSFGHFHLSPVVNAAPAVATVQLADSDEFVILANRVLWNHMSYQTAVDIARMERDDPMLAAQKLRDIAISYGAEESIVIMIVAVSDLFFKRPNRGGDANGITYDSMPDSTFRKAGNRRMREELPSDRLLARLEREVPPPIGHVALVFTDIKNSTALWETNGGMHAAMRLHNYLLRRQLRTCGGYEVKTEGDAFMVSFPTVTSALLWCFTVQEQLLDEDWPQEILESEDGKEVYDSNGQVIYRGLSVRMGVHWGWPVCEADPITRRMDYFGPMVNRSARISGSADGGQIMASRDAINEVTKVLTAVGEVDQHNANGNADAELDEDSFRMMFPNVSREVVLLRRRGFGISEVGERRMKGLETPEFLQLVYPKRLAGRLEAKPDAPAPQVFEPTEQLLVIDEVKQLGMLTLRLEALSNGEIFPGISGSGTNESPAAEASDGHTDAVNAATPPFPSHPSAHPLPPLAVRRKAVEDTLTLHPELLVYAIRDDATDEELAGILEQLITRVQNALCAIAVRGLLDEFGRGGDGEVGNKHVWGLLRKLM